MKEIPLNTRTGNKLKGKFVAMVDDDMYPFVSIFNWTVTYSKDADTYYAVRSYYPEKGVQIKIKMHRFIFGITDSNIHVDHEDHNGLNNQSYNLRPGTPLQNMLNKKPYKNCVSKYKGVSWRKNRKRWRALINVNGKCIALGSFVNEIDAAKAYDKGAIKYFGKWAFLNFPDLITPASNTPLGAVNG